LGWRHTAVAALGWHAHFVEEVIEVTGVFGSDVWVDVMRGGVMVTISIINTPIRH
jgi:hypothetical protein